MVEQWKKQTVSPYELQVQLVRAFTEIAEGDPEKFLADSVLPNSTVKHYLQQVAIFPKASTIDALVANLRDAVFNFENEEEAP